jgi:hypothetical protein
VHAACQRLLNNLRIVNYLQADKLRGFPHFLRVLTAGAASLPAAQSDFD